MTTRAFQKLYTKIDNITKATVTLRATGVGNDELATVGGKLAQVCLLYTSIRLVNLGLISRMRGISPSRILLRRYLVDRFDESSRKGMRFLSLIHIYWNSSRQLSESS